MSNKLEFAHWLKREREKLKLSQNELANLAGMSRAIINKTENGANDPHPKTLMALAKALSYPVEHLYRLMGYLPPVTKATELSQQIVHESNSLPEDEKENVLEYVRLRLHIAEERRKNVTKST